MSSIVPHNTQAERGILVCLFRNPKSMVKVVDRLKPEHFYHEEFGQVWEAALALYARKKLPTMQNLADELLRRGSLAEEDADPGALLYKFTRTEDSELSFHDIEDYADIVLRKSTARRLAQAGERIFQSGMRDEEDALGQAEEAITAIAMDGGQRSGAMLNDAIDRWLTAYNQRRADVAAGKPIGVSSGFRAVDWLTGRFRSGTLNILAAATGAGKTSLALNMGLNIAKNAIENGYESAIFSLEMLEDELVQRLLAVESHVDQSLLRDGKTEEEQHQSVLDMAESLRSAKLTIFDSVYRLDHIKSMARTLCTRRKIGLLIIDYVQLINFPPSERGKNQPRHQELGAISKELKHLAQELKVPILALAQINREGRKAGALDLHHLGESGQLENDADLVAFVSCDEANTEKRARSERYRMDFSVKKNRNGRLGDVSLMFDPTLTRFDDMLLEDA